MTDTQTQVGVRRNRAWNSPTTIFLLGVLLVPGLLGIAANSWSEPHAADFVRMAFATVIGATVAIGTVVGLWVFFLRRRSPYLFWYTLGAVFAVAMQVSFVFGAAETLLYRLALS